jgi:hypothetical protein
MTQVVTETSQVCAKLPHVVKTATEALKNHPKVQAALFGQPLYGTVILSDSFGSVHCTHVFGEGAHNTNAIYGRALERIYRLTYNGGIVLAREGEDVDKFAAGVRLGDFLLAVSGPQASIAEIACYRIGSKLGLLSREDAYALLRKFPNPLVTLTRKPDLRDLVLLVE